MAFLTGRNGDDELTVDESGAIAFVFGGSDRDTISATGSTSTSSNDTTRTFVFGGEDADLIQASRGKSFAFGQKGDDTMSADWDGNSNNDDKRDRHWGNRGSDAMYGDSADKSDRLYRGFGNDPSRTWNGWPSSPDWGSTNQAPSFPACNVIPEPICEGASEPPQDVGAK